MFKIGEFSKMTKTTVKTLRYYDEMNLLKPAFVDNLTGYRFYTTEQLIKLHKITSLKQLGLSIKDILLIISGDNYKNILKQRKKQLKKEISIAIKQLSHIENILLEEESLMVYNAVIKEIPEQIVYSKKMKVKDYNSYFSVIPEIGKEVSELNPNLQMANPEYCFIVYLDGEYKEKDFNIEFCEAVKEFGNGNKNISFKKMDKITVVSIMHKGSYDSIREAYAYGYNWIKENGYKIIDNPRESYIDGVWNKEDEKDWLTELQIPIDNI